MQHRVGSPLPVGIYLSILSNEELKHFEFLIWQYRCKPLNPPCLTLLFPDIRSVSFSISCLISSKSVKICKIIKLIKNKEYKDKQGSRVQALSSAALSNRSVSTGGSDKTDYGPVLLSGSQLAGMHNLLIKYSVW